jgi:tRNA(Ile)-lysidine synthase
VSDLPARTLTFIRHENLIEPHQSVLVGLSGGIDSTALLSVLHSFQDAIPFTLAVAHINHMLRGPESERDEDFVRKIAGQLSIPVHVKRVNVHDLAMSTGKSIQHAGRDVRYEYFSELVRAYDYQRIAIAHNQDDQVETFVLRLIKGTGVRGLSCIPVRRGSIIRPFLDTTRWEIEQYVAERGIRYVEDSSNRKDVYERNYVRHRILPSMEQLNPTVRSRVMNLLEDLTRLNERLDREAEAFFETCRTAGTGGHVLPLEQLKACNEETRFRVLSLVLSDLAPGFIALREHIRLIEKVLASSRPSSVAVLPSGLTVRREYDKVVFTTAVAPTQISETFEIHPGTTAIEPLGIGIDVSIIDHIPGQLPSDPHTAFLDGQAISNLTIRTFQNGDRFMPLGMKDTVKLKDYFISKKIHREARRQIPLLLIGDRIAWIIGERIDNRFKITAQTKKVLCITVRKLSTISQ